MSPQVQAVGFCYTHTGIKASAHSLLRAWAPFSGPYKRYGCRVSAHKPQHALMCMLASNVLQAMRPRRMMHVISPSSNYKWVLHLHIRAECA